MTLHDHLSDLALAIEICTSGEEAYAATRYSCAIGRSAGLTRLLPRVLLLSPAMSSRSRTKATAKAKAFTLNEWQRKRSGAGAWVKG
jgi:hypothetical protein